MTFGQNHALMMPPRHLLNYTRERSMEEEGRKRQEWIQKFYSRKKIGSLFRNRIDLIGSNFKLNLQGQERNRL